MQTESVDLAVVDNRTSLEKRWSSCSCWERDGICGAGRSSHLNTLAECCTSETSGLLRLPIICAAAAAGGLPATSEGGGFCGFVEGFLILMWF